MILDINKMLGELKLERDHIEEAILVLERLASGRNRRRGRPPSWLKHTRASAHVGTEDEFAPALPNRGQTLSFHHLEA